MPGNVNAIPEGYHSVTPDLVFLDAAQAIEFYKRVQEFFARLPKRT